MVTNIADAGTRREEPVPIDLYQPIALHVHNPNGDVTVRAADRSDVLIGHVSPGDDEVEVMIDTRDNRIEVRAIPRAGAGWAGASADIDLDAVVGQITRAFRRGGPWSPGKLGKVRVGAGGHSWCDITIDVPRTISGQVEVHTASGDVRVEGVTGEIGLKTASGDVRVVRTAGDLVLKTASGDLGIEGTSGRLTAQTASGDVRVASAQIEVFTVQTASGDIVLDALLSGDGPCRAQTASGDVRLTLRRPTTAGEEPEATLAFHTVSGDAHVTAPFRKTERRLWRSGASDGGPRIEVTTVSGNLSAGLTAAESGFVPPSRLPPATDDAPPAPSVSTAPVIAPARASFPTEPAPRSVSWPRGEIDLAATDASSEAAQTPASDDAARLAVLEAVERGEIDVEEALRQLEVADDIKNP